MILGRIEPTPSDEERAAIEAAIVVLSSIRGDLAVAPYKRKSRWGDLAIAPYRGATKEAGRTGWTRVARLEALEPLV